MVSPAVEDLAERYLGQLWVVKAQMEKCPEVFSEHSIDKLPTFVIIKDGQESDRLEGAPRWAILNDFIQRNLNA